MDKRKTLPHHGARHGTVEMVDASNEDGSSLSFNFGGTVASSRRPPSSWRPPLGLAMISLECPPPRVSLIVDLLFLGSSEELTGVCGRKRGAEPPPEGAGPTDLGRSAWDVPSPISAHLVTHFVFCILDHGPLQLWALDVAISAAKFRDLYA
jgi:hypothetical protein